MARTDLSVTVLSAEGVDDAGVAGIADGHAFRNTGREFLEVENTDVASRSVTIPTPLIVAGRAVEEQIVAVPAGARRLIGPFDERTYEQGSASADAGKVYVNYEATFEATFLTRCFRLPD